MGVGHSGGVGVGHSGGGGGGGDGRSLVHGLSEAQWRELQKHFHLSPQQGLIVKLLLTQPWYECDHIDIAKLLNTGKSGIDTQVEIIFKRIGIHSRMHLAQVVDYEVVRRGWVKIPPRRMSLALSGGFRYALPTVLAHFGLDDASRWMVIYGW